MDEQERKDFLKVATKFLKWETHAEYFPRDTEYDMKLDCCERYSWYCDCITIPRTLELLLKYKKQQEDLNCVKIDLTDDESESDNEEKGTEECLNFNLMCTRRNNDWQEEIDKQKKELESTEIDLQNFISKRDLKRTIKWKTMLIDRLEKERPKI